MKRFTYIASFVFLGFLFQLLVHGILETWYIGLLVERFDTFSLGLTWDQWFTIHHIGVFVLLSLGLLVGYQQGVRWWKRIYIQGLRVPQKK